MDEPVVGGVEPVLGPVALLLGGVERPLGSLQFTAAIRWRTCEDRPMLGPLDEEAPDALGVVVGGEAGVGDTEEGVEDFPVGGALVGEDAAVVDVGEAGDVPGVGGVLGAALADVAGEAFQRRGAEQVHLGPRPALDPVDDQRNAKLILNVVLGGDALGYDLYRRLVGGVLTSRRADEMCRADRTGMSSGVTRSGCSVTAAAAAHGYTRAGFYLIAGAFEERGMAGLVDDRPGRRGPFKLNEEIVGFLREAEPELSGAALARRVEERFGVSLHRRTVDRARRP